MNRGLGLLLAAILAVLVLVGLIGACQGPQSRTLPPPSSTSSTVPPVTTTDPDYSLVALEPIPGQTTTTAPMAVGSATIRGVVDGPDGRVPGAVVRAERLVGDAVQRIDVRTGDDGTYTIADVPGGRFRVRAFLPPTLAMDSAEIFFLNDGDERELRLVVKAFPALSVRASTTPAAPVVGQRVNLAVRVAQFTVDDDGVARETPQADVLVRLSSSGWSRADGGSDDDGGFSDPFDDDDDASPRQGTRGDYVLRTDGNGIALFQFRCDRVTSVTATALVGVEERPFPLDPPPCRPVPTTTTTTTTTAPDDDDDDGGDTTTSTSTTAP